MNKATRSRSIASTLAILALLLGCVLYYEYLLAHSGRPYDRVQACSSNLRQLYTGMSLYAQDWDSRLPPAAWMDATYPYVEDTAVYHCPEVVRSHPNEYGYAY